MPSLWPCLLFSASGLTLCPSWLPSVKARVNLLLLGAYIVYSHAFVFLSHCGEAAGYFLGGFF